MVWRFLSAEYESVMSAEQRRDSSDTRHKRQKPRPHISFQFIADIRGARVRELEEKRINKEMANIRKRFKGTSHILNASRNVTDRLVQTAISTGTRKRSEEV